MEQRVIIFGSSSGMGEVATSPELCWMWMAVPGWGNRQIVGG